MKTLPIPLRCPVCGHHVAIPFFDAGEQTLATVAWPASAEEARVMPRHRLDFVQCPACSHVYNRAFDYRHVPYESKPNRMFNRGAAWRGQLAAFRDLILGQLPERPTVVEIGCGDGSFLHGLAEARAGTFVGFDPNGTATGGGTVSLQRRLFEPLSDIAALRPDMIVIRHVLEHLTEPAALLDQFAWAAAALDKPCRLFAEVPCIDRVFATDRLADFFFEHYSHFTTESFRALLGRAGAIEQLAHAYDREVLYGVVALGVPAPRRDRARDAAAFAERSVASRATIAGQLDKLAADGKRIAIWGGTGKGAAFIHYYGADAVRFPLVVDSDIHKVGTFVPGTGQRIAYRDELKDRPADIVIIPTQWRALDILTEMASQGIKCEQVLIEHGGRLVDFHRDEHPYRREAVEG